MEVHGMAANVIFVNPNGFLATAVALSTRQGPRCRQAARAWRRRRPRQPILLTMGTCTITQGANAHDDHRRAGRDLKHASGALRAYPFGRLNRSRAVRSRSARLKKAR
nr:hypothetical protein [Mesorhizobium silamurunense]